MTVTALRESTDAKTRSPLPIHRDLYYGGAWQKPQGGYEPTWNPATGESLGDVPNANAADVDAAAQGDFPAFWEAVLGTLLLVGAGVLIATNNKEIREINIFAAVLIVQSLPFLAAVAIASIEATRLNNFAFWRSIEARVTELLPWRPAVAEVQARSDKSVETAP